MKNMSDQEKILIITMSLVVLFVRNLILETNVFFLYKLYLIRSEQILCVFLVRSGDRGRVFVCKLLCRCAIVVKPTKV